MRGVKKVEMSQNEEGLAKKKRLLVAVI